MLFVHDVKSKLYPEFTEKLPLFKFQVSKYLLNIVKFNKLFSAEVITCKCMSLAGLKVALF